MKFGEEERGGVGNYWRLAMDLVVVVGEEMVVIVVIFVISLFYNNYVKNK